MAKEGNVGWVQPAGNTGPQINITIIGGGIDFVGRISSLTYPDEAIVQNLGFFTTIDGVESRRWRIYGQLPPSPPPTPGPTPPPPPYTPPVSAPQRLKVIRCNGTGGYKHLSVSPFGNYSNGMSIRFGSPYPSGYCYTIIDQDTTGSLVDGTSISVLSAYLTCTSCNSSLPTISGTTGQTCLDNGGQNGRITVTPSGGTGVYYFTLNGAGSYGIAGAAATNADGLADGAYTITLYDDGGNSAALTGQTLACYVAPNGTVTQSCTSTNNAGGKITVTSPTGGTGTGYYFTLNGAGSYSIGATGATGLADGSYIVRLYDSIGNVSVLSTETIACYVAPTGTISVTCVDTTGTNARIDVIDVAGGTGAGYYFTVDGSGTYTTGAGNGPTGFADSTTHSVVLYDSYGNRSLGNTTIPVCYVAPPPPTPAPAAPTPAPAAPTPAPAAPTPSPEAPTPSPEAPTPTPAASCFQYEITSTDGTYGADISGIDCDGNPYFDTGFFGTVSLCFQQTPNVSGGYSQFTGTCTPPTPAPAAPTPAAPTPAPAAPTPAPAAPSVCEQYEIQNMTESAIGISYYDCSGNYTTDTIGSGNNLVFCSDVSYGAINNGGGQLYDIGECPGAPTPAPAAPTPAPAAPTPAPAAPTPAPAAPTLDGLNYGFHGSDPDIACTNWETGGWVLKYNENNSPTANGISIFDNSNGTGTPTDGYYAIGGSVWYSTSGVLSGGVVCYGGAPTPAAPPPAAPPPAAPTPSPAAVYEYWDYEPCTGPNAYTGAQFTLQEIPGNTVGCILYDGETWSVTGVGGYPGPANYTLFNGPSSFCGNCF